MSLPADNGWEHNPGPVCLTRRRLHALGNSPAGESRAPQVRKELSGATSRCAEVSEGRIGSLLFSLYPKYPNLFMAVGGR